MTREVLAWEIIKLFLQAAGALLVARLAVKWALDRFKREKLWERRLAAQADILAALGGLRRLYGGWLDDIENHRERSDDDLREQNERYRAANRRLQEATAVGAMLLPVEVRQRLALFERETEAVHETDRYDGWNRHYGLLDDAINDLVQEGRALLR